MVFSHSRPLTDSGPQPTKLDRRTFIHGLGAAMLAGWSGVRAAEAGSSPLFSAIGTNGMPDQAVKFKAMGIEFLNASTSKLLIPDRPDEEFAKRLESISCCPLPILSCNGFIRPSHLRCVGEEANHDEVLDWAGTALRRLKQVGGRFMVFGSDGSRSLRAGWSKEQADRQFVDLLRRMGPLAQRHGVTVVVEPLNARECNYITRIGEAASLIRRADHPHIRVCADLYHMAVGGDAPEDLRQAADVVALIEIAEKVERAFPGVGGQDFRPYFRVLKAAGYRDAINIEASGSMDQLARAVRVIRGQAAEVMAED